MKKHTAKLDDLSNLVVCITLSADFRCQNLLLMAIVDFNPFFSRLNHYYSEQNSGYHGYRVEALF